MPRRPAASYGVIRLHSYSDNAWAVVEAPSGAIALDADARLLMRLFRKDALHMAEALTFAAKRAPGLAPVVSLHADGDALRAEQVRPA